MLEYVDDIKVNAKKSTSVKYDVLMNKGNGKEVSKPLT